MADITPDPIMRIAMDFMAAKHLFVASEVELFSGLVPGPATLDELAARCGSPRRTASIISTGQAAQSGGVGDAPAPCRHVDGLRPYAASSCSRHVGRLLDHLE